MADCTIAFYTLLSMTDRFCRLVKINIVFLKDTAFISSKSSFDQCKHCWVISEPKMQTDRQTDGFSALYSRWHCWVMSVPKMQTDRQTAFQLYIVDYQEYILYYIMYTLVLRVLRMLHQAIHIQWLLYCVLWERFNGSNHIACIIMCYNHYS